VKFLCAGVVLVCLIGCGDLSLVDGPLPPIPTISSFTADPPSLGADGGTTVLSWTVVNEDALSLEPGIGTVTGYTAANATLTATTTYTLYASNSLGVVSATCTVSVGP
jgi:hypothetical protein